MANCIRHSIILCAGCLALSVNLGAALSTLILISDHCFALSTKVQFQALLVQYFTMSETRCLVCAGA